MLNDCGAQPSVPSPSGPNSGVMDNATVALLDAVAAAGAGASAEGLKAAYRLAEHVIEHKKENAVSALPLEGMLELLVMQANEMSSVRCQKHLSILFERE